MIEFLLLYSLGSKSFSISFLYMWSDIWWLFVSELDGRAPSQSHTKFENIFTVRITAPNLFHLVVMTISFILPFRSVIDQLALLYETLHKSHILRILRVWNFGGYIQECLSKHNKIMMICEQVMRWDSQNLLILLYSLNFWNLYLKFLCTHISKIISRCSSINNFIFKIWRDFFSMFFRYAPDSSSNILPHCVILLNARHRRRCFFFS